MMKPAVRDLTLESKSKFPHLSESVSLAVKKGHSSTCLPHTVDCKMFYKLKSTAQKYRISLPMLPKLYGKLCPLPLGHCSQAS